jgi:6-phosphogluconolactonase
MSESVEVYADGAALAEAVAEQLITRAWSAIAARGRFSIGLSGGSTPRGLFEMLAHEPYAPRLDWSKIHVFWGDERSVPPDDPDSNYGMAREALLSYVPLPEENVYRMRGELPPAEAADQYEQVLRDFFADQKPRFDLLLQGMGDDGHTASLFPHTKGLRERNRWVIPNYVPKLDTWRITLTVTAINAAREVIFMVSGAGKAKALHDVIEGPHQPETLPSQFVAPANGEVVWVVDEAAASLLRRH